MASARRAECRLYEDVSTLAFHLSRRRSEPEQRVSVAGVLVGGVLVVSGVVVVSVTVVVVAVCVPVCCSVPYTEGEVTSRNFWPRHDRHFVGRTRHNVWS